LGTFNAPVGVGADNSLNPADSAAGDVYVVDTGNHRVVRFDASGNPAAFSAVGPNISGNALTGTPTVPFATPSHVAIDPADGDFYVTDSTGGAVYKFNPAGALLATIDASTGVPVGNSGSFNPFGVVVDPSNEEGNVYVENRGYNNGNGLSQRNQIAKFNSAGKFNEKDGGIFATGPIFGDPPLGNFAINSAGDFYVVLLGEDVNEYDPHGVKIGVLDSKSPTAVAIDPTNGDIYVAENSPRREIRQFNSANEPIDSFGLNSFGATLGLAVDASHNVYVADNGGTTVSVFHPGTPPAVITKSADDVTGVSARLNGFTEPAGNGEITSCHFEYGTDKSYGLGSIPCKQLPPISSPTQVTAIIQGLNPELTYHFRLVASNASAGSTNPGADETFTTSPIATPEVGTGNATNITQVTAMAQGIADPAGPPILHCYFVWGTTVAYTKPPVPCDQNGSLPFLIPTEVTATFSGLKPATTYHYSLVAENEEEVDILGQDETFTTLPNPPTVSALSALEVRSDVTILHANINPNKGDTTYHFEYVDAERFQASGFTEAVSVPIPDGDAGSGSTSVVVSRQTGVLVGGTEYHFRLVATNSGGTSTAEHTFKTFSPLSPTDTCPNAHVRQQTSAAHLRDCRAYELVSAANTGGYNVESSLIAGESPFGGYPQASGAAGPSRLLYSVHDGGVPGVGDPTNKGNDPYVATRGKDSWSTSYVGIPASGTPSVRPFSSSLVEADPRLEAFAFGGDDICAPCFSDESSGIPIHMPNGSLVQGMAGSIPQPLAVPTGTIGKHFSADGSHFVFGSTSQFESDGNNNGDVSIYDRNLTTGVTHVVSKTPGESTMTGPGIAELDISSDGSRIVVGQLVSTDVKGNSYYHLFMNVDDSAKTIDLTPGATDGVLYDGMTADGSKVFFTTKDQLAGGADTDSSADIYQAEVSTSSATITRISTGTGGSGDTDSCKPTESWNTVSGKPNCDVVAIGGGGGVASGDGTIYLFSPELLDGPENGVQNEPNLYVVRPGSTPHFIATLETIATSPPPEETTHPFVRSFGKLAGPQGIAVNQKSNDVYVTDPGNERMARFDANGDLISVFGREVNQTTGGDVCTIASFDVCVPGTVGTEPGEFNAPAFVAVDNSTNPSDPSVGDVYVADNGGDRVMKFDASGTLIDTWGAEGQLGGFAGFAGATVSSNGNLVILESSGFISEFEQDGTFIRQFGTDFGTSPAGVAVDSEGNIYKVRGSGATAKLNPTGSSLNGEFDPGTGTGLAIDSSDGLYVLRSEKVIHYSIDGGAVETFGGAQFASGAGVALSGRGHVYVTDSVSGTVKEFGSPAGGNNPAVVDGVNEAGTRRTADFQVNPSGVAVFSTALPLKADYNSAGHREIYRYDPASATLTCASCNPTNGDAIGDSTLATDGLSITDRGSVFFNSADSLAARDEDRRTDVYEWEGPDASEGAHLCLSPEGCIGLISTGTSRFDSKLIGADADGTDAFFFTRDILVPQDENGTLTKIYDAREFGGFPFIPAPVPCKASDECHGPSSQAARPPNVGSLRGSGGNYPPRCKKHLIKRHGKCVKRRHNHRRNHKKARQND
jgi:sugar lactone lactonase YvrE